MYERIRHSRDGGASSCRKSYKPASLTEWVCSAIPALLDPAFNCWDLGLKEKWPVPNQQKIPHRSLNSRYSGSKHSIAPKITPLPPQLIDSKSQDSQNLINRMEMSEGMALQWGANFKGNVQDNSPPQRVVGAWNMPSRVMVEADIIGI